MFGSLCLNFPNSLPRGLLISSYFWALVKCRARAKCKAAEEKSVEKEGELLPRNLIHPQMALQSCEILADLSSEYMCIFSPLQIFYNVL